ncbi:MAG: TIM barrel protein, partial [Syntrophales bacterium]|nr:TIM barrel protein [Syntrophales bacterium]
MIRLGFHTSIAGGLMGAIAQANSLGCRTMQIFTRNPRGWMDGKEIEPVAARSFREALARHDIAPLVVHMPYLPNFATPDPALYERSVAA